MGTSSKIGRLARLGYPAVTAIPASLFRLFDEALADETEGFSGCKNILNGSEKETYDLT